MDGMISEGILIQIKKSYLESTIFNLSFIDHTDMSLTLIISKFTKVKLYMF
jgi:hypothetical protein